MCGFTGGRAAVASSRSAARWIARWKAAVGTASEPSQNDPLEPFVCTECVTTNPHWSKCGLATATREAGLRQML